MQYHYHIMTRHGEDVACSTHTVQALVANVDEVSIAHEDNEDCTRCFVCEGYAPGGQLPPARAAA